MSHTFPSLVLSEGEEEDDVDHDVEDVAATVDSNDNDNKDNNGTSMPPKVKPLAVAAAKTAKKKTTKADEVTHLPVPKLPKIRTFSIEAENPLTVSYYATDKHDYADVVIRVNRMMKYCECEVQVAKDGHLILFVCTIHAKLFDNIILKKNEGQLPRGQCSHHCLG